LKRSDIEQIVHNAYRYGDEEVINLLSKNHRTAGIFDGIANDFNNMVSGIGLQRSQTPTGAQFTSSKDFQSFSKGAGAEANNYAIEGIIKFWADALKANSVTSIPIPALREEREFEKNPDGTIKKDSLGNPIVAVMDKEYTYQFKPGPYIEESRLKAIWDSLTPESYNKKFGVDPALLPLTPGEYDLGTNNSPSVFERVITGKSAIRFKDKTSSVGALVATDKFETGRTFIKIESNGVGDKGYIEVLKEKLATNFPKENDDNHVQIMNVIGMGINDSRTGLFVNTNARYYDSLLRQTSIGKDKIQGLASTWNYIVGLPDLIQKRQNKTPGGLLEYKQKMILKAKGIELQKLLNKQYDYIDPITQQKKVVRLSNLNRVPKEDFVVFLPKASIDLKSVGICVAQIQQELDKENSIVRKFIKDVAPEKNPFSPGGSNVKL
jgi:hypothetical protein